MSLRHYIVVFVAAFAGSFFLASCLNEDNRIPPNCYDGILNNNEQLVDCGGPCPACNHCIDGIWQPNLGETCVDCGGECGACQQCSNCVQDGDESGIDCGGTFCGPCAGLCEDGILNGNETGIDCGGSCDPCPTCTDGVMNGTEIGIDCGGTACPPCTTDGNCRNLIIDGNEFWVDCGGSHCPACEATMSWRVNNVNHTVLAANINKSFNGNSLTVTGTSLQGATLTITTTTPAAGWVDGASVNMTQATFPDRQIAYQDEFGNNYSTGVSAAGSGALTITRFVTTPNPGVIRGAFNGTLYNAGGTGSINVTNGLFMVNYQ
jgi:hypothetical protein